MNTPLSRLALVFTGLALSLTACDNRELVAASTTEESSITGNVAFRLSDTVLQVVKQTSDSVRIEAVREGYTTQMATGSIGGNTLLTGLAPGTWTLKVATFDTLQAVSWYGETTVQVESGKTANAVVVLKRASGSVNVQIVLDTVQTTVDTVTVNRFEGNPGDFQPLPIEGAWRTDKGIYIATRYDYFQPVVVHDIMQSSLPQRLYLVGNPFQSYLPVKLLPHILFVPFPAAEDVIVSNLANDTVFMLPGNPLAKDPETDTVVVNYTQGDLADYKGIPVDSAWRTNDGIYIATWYDYFVPAVVSSPTQTMYPQKLTLVGTPVIALNWTIYLLPHVVFVPFPSTQSVSIANLLDDSIINLPVVIKVVSPESTMVD
jgi:hypothetical protein